MAALFTILNNHFSSGGLLRSGCLSRLPRSHVLAVGLLAHLLR
jgi:hypothetical protein